MVKHTVASIRVKNKLFEILVDLELALKIRKGEPATIQSALLGNDIYTNSKTGAKASNADLIDCFTTADVFAVATRIIQKGNIELPKDYRDDQQEAKKKKIIDWFVRNAVDARNSRPFTPDQIAKSLEQAKVNLSNGNAESLIPVVTEALQKILPLKIETKRLAITIPAIHTGKVYGIVNEYKDKEEWLSNGDLRIIVNIPVGLQLDFYDKLNSVTHGAALTEELKEK